jgi:hypothetical protein
MKDDIVVRPMRSRCRVLEMGQGDCNEGITRTYPAFHPRSRHFPNRYANTAGE